VAIEKAIKSQQVTEIMKKFPSSEPIKECVEHYDTMVSEVQGAMREDPENISLTVNYARDALDRCKRSLVDEKVVDTSSIDTLNREMQLYIDIVFFAGSHL
jgi:hypothetical protein